MDVTPLQIWTVLMIGTSFIVLNKINRYCRKCREDCQSDINLFLEDCEQSAIWKTKNMEERIRELERKVAVLLSKQPTDPTAE